MTELEKLKEELRRLKDKETKLEADLAIREYPEIEIAIYEIVIALAKIRKSEKSVINLSACFDVKRAEIASKQATFYRQKVAELDGKTDQISEKLRKYYSGKLAATLSGSSRKITFESTAAKVNVHKAEMQKAYNKWKPLMEKARFDIVKLLPSVADYLEI